MKRSLVSVAAVLAALAPACASSIDSATSDSNATASARPTLDCRTQASLCWEDQTCDHRFGYCKERTLDDTLDYDVQLYDLALDFHSATGTFDATVAVYFAATRTGTTSIALSTAPSAGSTTPWYAVRSVTNGAGHALAFHEDSAAGVLEVELGASLAKGAAAVVMVSYAGAANPITDTEDPLYATGLMYRPARDGTPTLQTYSWPDHTRRWLPSHDHPHDSARLISRIGVDIPGATILSNGVSMGETSDGTLTRKTFALRQPVPAYAYFVGARPFVVDQLGVTDGVPASTYLYSVDAAASKTWRASILGAQRFLDDRLGENPFETYGVVELPDPNGGMEHATIVSIADGDFSDKATNRDTVIHELTHHYFGDNAHIARWDDFWLNESLATFLTASILGAEDGEDAYTKYITGLRADTVASPSDFGEVALHPHHDPEIVPTTGPISFFYAPYYKGAVVWHMLKKTMDDATFWRFLRTFYERSRFRAYDTALFVQVLNEVTGRDNAQFVNEWIEQAGWPTLTPAFTYDAGAVTLTVAQTQDKAKFGTYSFAGPLALSFDLDDDDASTPTCTAKVEFTAGAATATVTTPCAYAPTKITYASTDILADVVEGK